MKTCKCCNKNYKTLEDFDKTSRWFDHGGYLWFNCACESTLIMKKEKLDPTFVEGLKATREVRTKR